MKRVWAAALCALLLLTLAASGAAAEAGVTERLSYISVNDTLPRELVGRTAVSGGVTYVPYYVFTDYGLGMTYTYYISASTAYLARDDKQLFFDMNSGETYDGEDNRYAASAITWNGTVYVPAGMVCRFFGLGCSYIAGNEYGSILRLTTDAVLSDAEFLKAARGLMRSHYLSWMSEAASAAPSAAPNRPKETKPPEEPETHEGDRVLLYFVGPPAGVTLEQLSLRNVHACFLLTEEDVRAGADLVRRAVGEGHSVGVWCEGDPAADWAKTSPLLFEAARVRTVLAAGPEALAARAEEAGLVWCPADYGFGTDTETLPEDMNSASLRLRAGGDAAELEALLDRLLEQRYELVCPRET